MLALIESNKVSLFMQIKTPDKQETINLFIAEDKKSVFLLMPKGYEYEYTIWVNNNTYTMRNIINYVAEYYVREAANPFSEMDFTLHWALNMPGISTEDFLNTGAHDVQFACGIFAEE